MTPPTSTRHLDGATWTATASSATAGARRRRRGAPRQRHLDGDAGHIDSAHLDSEGEQLDSRRDTHPRLGVEALGPAHRRDSPLRGVSVPPALGLSSKRPAAVFDTIKLMFGDGRLATDSKGVYRVGNRVRNGAV